MTEAEGAGSVLAWVIPPSGDPRETSEQRSTGTAIRRLADELERICRPESVSVEVVPAGVSRIRLRFEDREAAFRSYDAVGARLRADPGVVCRVVATTPRPPE